MTRSEKLAWLCFQGTQVCWFTQNIHMSKTLISTSSFTSSRTNTILYTPNSFGKEKFMLKSLCLFISIQIQRCMFAFQL